MNRRFRCHNGHRFSCVRKNLFQTLENSPTLFPMSGKTHPAFLQNLQRLIRAWGRRSLGSIIREWWSTQSPTPWSKEDQDAANSPDAVSVCHHCLTPQEHSGWFCPNCGAATGPYNNCMPFINIFSQGETLRAGVNEKIQFARWVYPAYFLMALGALFIFAPLYWIRLFRAQKRRKTDTAPEINHDE